MTSGDESENFLLDGSAEGEATLERLLHLRKLARGYTSAARRAVGYARRYRAEEGHGGEREIGCLLQANRWREEARTLRREASRETEAARQDIVRVGQRPGLARAKPDEIAAEHIATATGTKRGA